MKTAPPEAEFSQTKFALYSFYPQKMANLPEKKQIPHGAFLFLEYFFFLGDDDDGRKTSYPTTFTNNWGRVDFKSALEGDMVGF